MGNALPSEDRPPSLLRALGDGDFLRFFVVEVVLSAVCGLIAAAVSRDAVSSFIISLLVMIMLLMVEIRGQLLVAKTDVHTQLMKVNGELQQEIVLTKEVLAQALQLQREGLNGHLPFNKIQEIVTGFTHVQASGDAFFLARAHELIKHCAQNISDFQQGHMEVQPIGIYVLSRQCLRVANSSVFATSFARTADFWVVEGGPDYLKENLDAAKRGVHVTRVFILDSGEEVNKRVGNKTVRDILNEQMEGGIDVKITYVDNLKAESRHDMAIFDDKYVEYLDLETRGGKLHRTDAELNKARDIRDYILGRATDARTLLDRIPPRPRNSRRRKESAATVSVA